MQTKSNGKKEWVGFGSRDSDLFSGNNPRQIRWLRSPLQGRRPRSSLRQQSRSLSQPQVRSLLLMLDPISQPPPSTPSSSNTFFAPFQILGRRQNLIFFSISCFLMFDSNVSVVRGCRVIVLISPLFIWLVSVKHIGTLTCHSV